MKNTPDAYKVPTSNFLPSFFTVSYDDNGKKVYNDANLFEWKYLYYGGDDVIETVKCINFIETLPNLTDKERNALK